METVLTLLPSAEWTMLSRYPPVRLATRPQLQFMLYLGVDKLPTKELKTDFIYTETTVEAPFIGYVWARAIGQPIPISIMRPIHTTSPPELPSLPDLIGTLLANPVAIADVVNFGRFVPVSK